MSAKSVEEYINSANENGQKYISEFVEFMNKEYPYLNHKMCFSIPMWLVGTKMNEGYVGISAAKNHFSIHFSSDEFIIELAQKLPTCKTGRRCINIKYGDNESYRFIKEESIKEFLK